jgi:hypothetical protein
MTALGLYDFGDERLAAAASRTGSAALGNVGAGFCAASDTGSNLPITDAEAMTDDHEPMSLRLAY